MKELPGYFKIVDITINFRDYEYPSRRYIHKKFFHIYTPKAVPFSYSLPYYHFILAKGFARKIIETPWEIKAPKRYVRS